MRPRQPLTPPCSPHVAANCRHTPSAQCARVIAERIATHRLFLGRQSGRCFASCLDDRFAAAGLVPRSRHRLFNGEGPRNCNSGKAPGILLRSERQKTHARRPPPRRNRPPHGLLQGTCRRRRDETSGVETFSRIDCLPRPVLVSAAAGPRPRETGRPSIHLSPVEHPLLRRRRRPRLPERNANGVGGGGGGGPGGGHILPTARGSPTWELNFLDFFLKHAPPLQEPAPNATPGDPSPAGGRTPG